MINIYIFLKKKNSLEKNGGLFCINHIYPTPPLGQDMTQGQFFKAEFNRFEFRVVLLLD